MKLLALKLEKYIHGALTKKFVFVTILQIIWKQNYLVEFYNEEMEILT